MKCEVRTDIGRSRKNNQDSFVLVTNGNDDVLGVVCDGVGGAAHGEVASQTAVQWMKQQFEQAGSFLDLEDAKAWLYTSVVDTNDVVYKMAAANTTLSGMGTTLVAVLITKFGTIIANAGDSRAYGMDENGIFRVITTDHTYVGNLVSTGQISLQEAMNHPKRNVIVNAVGLWKKIEVDLFTVNDNTEKILLCSDGLHGYVNEEDIRAVLMTDSTTARKTDVLVDKANEAGGYDNVTVLLIEKPGR